MGAELRGNETKNFILYRQIWTKNEEERRTKSENEEEGGRTKKKAKCYKGNPLKRDKKGARGHPQNCKCNDRGIACYFSKFNDTCHACKMESVTTLVMLAILKIRQREREEMGKKDFTDVIGQSVNNTMAKQNFNNLFGTGEQMEEPSREEPKEPPKAKQKKPIKEKAKAAEQGAFVPVGYVLKEEPKSQRLQLLLKPSTLNGLKEESERTGESVNAICNRLFEDYLKRAKESIL